jgi:hypothetical protein
MKIITHLFSFKPKIRKTKEKRLVSIGMHEKLEKRVDETCEKIIWMLWPFLRLNSDSIGTLDDGYVRNVPDPYRELHGYRAQVT